MENEEGPFIVENSNVDATKFLRAIHLASTVLVGVWALFGLLRLFVISRHLHYKNNHLVRDREANRLDVEAGVPLERLQRAHLH